MPIEISDVSQPPNADGNPCNGDNTGCRGYVSSTITRFSFSYMYASHGVFPPRPSRGVGLNHSCVSATASGETDSKSVFFGAPAWKRNHRLVFSTSGLSVEQNGRAK